MASTLHVRSLPRPATPDDIQGIPDVFITRCLCFGFAAMLLVPAVMLTVYFPSEPTGQTGLGMLLLLGLLVLGLYGMVGYFGVAGARAGRAWLRVDRAGVYAGHGIEPGQADEFSLEWKDMAIDRNLVYDVSASSPAGGRAPASYLRYWRRQPDGSLAEGSLNLSLAVGLHCIRFSNHDALMRAILQHIARQPGLRIDGNLFVDAGFNPETWEVRKGPRRAMWVGTLAMLAIVFGLASLMIDWPPAAIALGTLVLFVIGMAVSVSTWRSTYAHTQGIFVFGEPAATPQAPVVQHARPRPAGPRIQAKASHIPRKRSRK